MKDDDNRIEATSEPDSQHASGCACWRCYSQHVGAFIDELGLKTAVGYWQFFLTQSYRTPSFPWAKGFPRKSEPHADFVHHFADYLISRLRKEFGPPIEYFFADQYGEAGGRLHQHFGISGPGLSVAFEKLIALHNDGKANQLPDELKSFQRMLWERAGFNRILPWLRPASYYIGRYIGRDVRDSYWDWELESATSPESRPVVEVGRVVVAASCDLPAHYYRGGILRRWHR
jgi:hypothetical protein